MSVTDMVDHGQDITLTGVAGVAPDFDRGLVWVGVVSRSGQLRAQPLSGTGLRWVPVLVDTEADPIIVQLDRPQPGKAVQLRRISRALVELRDTALPTEQSESRPFQVAEACPGVFLFATKEPDKERGNRIRLRVVDDMGRVTSTFDLATQSGVDQKTISKLFIDVTKRFVLVAANIGTLGADRRLAPAIDAGLYRLPIECSKVKSR